MQNIHDFIKKHNTLQNFSETKVLFIIEVGQLYFFIYTYR